MNFIAVDPGVKAGCACALFVRGVLIWAQFLRPGVPYGGPLKPGLIDFVIVERPQVDGRSMVARPKDLMDLSWAGAAVAYAFGASVWEVEPREWKSEVPKPVHHGRIWESLSHVERLILPPDTFAQIEGAKRKGALDRWQRPGVEYYPRAWTGHNLLDAAGLGVYARDNLHRRKV